MPARPSARRRRLPRLSCSVRIFPWGRGESRAPFDASRASSRNGTSVRARYLLDGERDSSFRSRAGSDALTKLGLATRAEDDVRDALRHIVQRVRKHSRPRGEGGSATRGTRICSPLRKPNRCAPSEEGDPTRSARRNGLPMTRGSRCTRARTPPRERSRGSRGGLCGYGARPPLLQIRLSHLPGGRIAYRLKRLLADGTELLGLEPCPRSATLERRSADRYAGGALVGMSETASGNRMGVSASNVAGASAPGRRRIAPRWRRTLGRAEEFSA